MRLFVGIEFPATVLDALSDCQNRLRGSAKRGRFKRRDNFHLTLKFLGEVPADESKRLIAPLAGIAQAVQPFCLSLGHMGQFGSGSSIRVVWVDVAGETDCLSRLQAQIEQALAEVGFRPEARRWQPHITLAQDVEFSGAIPAWAEFSIDNTAFEVSEFALILSEEQERRRVYTPIHRFVLGS